MISPTPLQRHCPICDANVARLLLHQNLVLETDHALSKIYADGYRAVLCEACAFAFADARATQADFDCYYARHSKYDDVAVATGGGGTPVDAQRLHHTARTLSNLIDNQSASILDIGCATGGLLRELQLLGFARACGLDPSPQSAIWARENWQIEIATGSLFEHALTEKFDVVVASHVLEHIFDLRGAAQALSELTKTEGALYLEVPDAARYDQFIVAPLQDFNIEHINHFSLRALDLLLQPHGFSRQNWGRKEFESAPGAPYPALWGWWRKTSNGETTPIADEPEFAAHLEKYIADSRQMLRAIDERLQMLPQREPIVVWGAGQLTTKLLAETALGGARIACFVDANAQHSGQTLHGAPVVSPTAALDLIEVQWPIVIASTIHGQAIARRIRDELKWPNPLVFLL